MRVAHVPALLPAMLCLSVIPAVAASPPAADDAPSALLRSDAPPSYDAALAQRLGADARGMRQYVLVVLKSGPTPVPSGPERDAMFVGHFANIERLSKAGKLAMAGPFAEDAAGWRGLYVFAVEDIEEARRLTEADPVVRQGEMVAEFHRWYGPAAAMLLPEWHARLVPPAKSP